MGITWELVNCPSDYLPLPRTKFSISVGRKRGGVWVMRQVNRDHTWEGMWRMRMRNACTMAERWKALEAAGAKSFERPEKNKYVKPLLEGFREHG